jgi:hypothetical protein
LPVASAESLEDSFDINEINNLPPHYQQVIGTYHIPSFGVDYGMQNQNYFTNIDVSMNTPNVTDQSLQAVFQMASEQGKEGSSDSSSQIRSLGQDMYRVYSNHAYQCTVSMLGCAWVQPLMYFQLLNIPLFRGAYIIHKVTHTISSNTMKTTFVGTKVSQASIRKLETSFYFTERFIKQKEYDLYEANLANFTNNCDYAYFNPLNEDGNKDERMVNELMNHFENKKFGNITYGIFYAIVLRETKDARQVPNLNVYNELYMYNYWSYYKNYDEDKINNLGYPMFFEEFFNRRGVRTKEKT